MPHGKKAKRNLRIDRFVCFFFGVALSNFATCIIWMLNT